MTMPGVEQLSMTPVRFFSSLTPAFLAAFAVALANLPVSFSGGILPPPLLGLTVIYFWTLLRADLVPPVLVLAIGLFEDLLSGGQPGLWAVGYLMAYALADRQRDAFAGLSGWGVMVGFSAVMFGAASVVYMAGSLVYWRLAPIQPLLIQAIITVIFYPLIAVILGLVHRRFVGASNSED